MEFGAYRWREINGAVMDSGSSAALRLALVLPFTNMVLCFWGRGGGRAERLTRNHESELELGWRVESKMAVCVCICFCVGGRSLPLSLSILICRVCWNRDSSAFGQRYAAPPSNFGSIK